MNNYLFKELLEMLERLSPYKNVDYSYILGFVKCIESGQTLSGKQRKVFRDIKQRDEYCEEYLPKIKKMLKIIKKYDINNECFGGYLMKYRIGIEENHYIHPKQVAFIDQIYDSNDYKTIQTKGHQELVNELNTIEIKKNINSKNLKFKERGKANG